jgi:hypothetical protein
MPDTNRTGSAALPTLAFRVGVTGARCPVDVLRPQVEAVLSLVRAEMTYLAGHHAVRSVYACGPDGAPSPPQLTVLSPLAEGSDRLVAEVGLELGYALTVPMPFARAVYERDFARSADSVASFRRLLARAGCNVVELDGSRDDPAGRHYHQSRSYEAVGRHVVHNCDLLIAIWDGRPPRGRGGTSDTIRHALSVGIPVWWIDQTNPSQLPIWLHDTLEPRFDPAGSAPWSALTEYIHQLVLPPRPPTGHAHAILDRLIGVFCPTPTPPHLRYFVAADTRRATPCWARMHGWMLTFLAVYRPRQNAQPPPDDRVARYWYTRYRQASGVSGLSGDQYRSSYVWVFLLIAASLLLAGFSLAAAPHDDWRAWGHQAAYPEAGVVALILLLLLANQIQGWHQTWVDTRLLTELLRQQRFLALIGWSLPARAVSGLVDQQLDQRDRDRSAWVPWYLGTLIRAAPMTGGALSGPLLRDAIDSIRSHLVQAQNAYHEARGKQYRRAARTLAISGELLFATVAFLIVVKVLHALGHPEGKPEVYWSAIEFLTVALPTVAAASVGIRAYAELQLLAEQSHHMVVVMRQALATLDRIGGRLDQPLASQDLGAALTAVTAAMLQDVDGWARMFRVKVIEAG